jgi:hypothetical protein
MVFRFYFRCSKCGAEMSMKTDPKNSDYIMEQGATRNYEPWREKDRVRAAESVLDPSLIPVSHPTPATSHPAHRSVQASCGSHPQLGKWGSLHLWSCCRRVDPDNSLLGRSSDYHLLFSWLLCPTCDTGAWTCRRWGRR